MQDGIGTQDQVGNSQMAFQWTRGLLISLAIVLSHQVARTSYPATQRHRSKPGLGGIEELD